MTISQEAIFQAAVKIALSPEFEKTANAKGWSADEATSKAVELAAMLYKKTIIVHTAIEAEFETLLAEQ